MKMVKILLMVFVLLCMPLVSMALDMVNINLNRADIEITGPDTIRMENVDAMGGKYWLNMKWDPQSNIFKYNGHGPMIDQGGVLYFSKDNDGNGLYYLDTETGKATHVGISGVTSSTVGLAYNEVSDILYGSKWSTLLHIRRNGSEAEDVGGAGTEGLAFDPNLTTLYGAINGRFFIMNPETGEIIEDLPGPGFDAEGLAVDPSTGTVYAVGNSNDLAAYNPFTREWTTIGDTGYNWYLGGLAYDPGQDVLYACASAQGTYLYIIDPYTAYATVIGDAGVGLRGGLAFAPGVNPANATKHPGQILELPELDTNCSDGAN